MTCYFCRGSLRLVPLLKVGDKHSQFSCVRRPSPRPSESRHLQWAYGGDRMLTVISWSSASSVTAVAGSLVEERHANDMTLTCDCLHEAHEYIHV